MCGNGNNDWPNALLSTRSATTGRVAEPPQRTRCSMSFYHLLASAVLRCKGFSQDHAEKTGHRTAGRSTRVTSAARLLVARSAGTFRAKLTPAYEVSSSR